MTNALSTDNKKLVIAHNLFMLARETLQIFMAIFIWKVSQDFSIIGLYYFSFITAHTISFTLFSFLLKKAYHQLVRSIGLLGSMVGYLTLFFLNEQAIDHIIFIGILLGFFNGAYWISYHILRFDSTHPHNRGNYQGWEKSLRTTANLLGPILGGALITYNLFDFAYGNIFLFACLAAFLSLLIGNIKVEKVALPALHIRKTWQTISKEKNIKKFFIAGFFGNISYHGVMARLIPVLIFSVLQQELHVGGWLTAFSLLAVITTFCIGRYVPYSSYRQAITLGGSLFFISTLSLAGLPNIVTYIIYGFAREAVLPLIKIPMQVYSDNLLQRLPDYHTHRVEYVLIKEWLVVSFSRAFSYSLLFFITEPGSLQLQIIIAIIAIPAILEIIFMRKIKVDISKV